MNTDEKIQHLNEVEDRDLIRNICLGKTTFKNEVEEFYGLATYLRAIPRIGVVREFDVSEAKSDRKGQIPIKLVNIVKEFSDKELQATNLTYDGVREDYRKWHNPVRNILRTTIHLGGLAAMTAGFIMPMTTYKNIYLSAPLLVGGASAFAWSLMFYPDPKGTNHELKSFINLHEAALSTDSFVRDIYKLHLIEKSFNGRK